MEGGEKGGTKRGFSKKVALYRKKKKKIQLGIKEKVEFYGCPERVAKNLNIEKC